MLLLAAATRRDITVLFKIIVNSAYTVSICYLNFINRKSQGPFSPPASIFGKRAAWLALPLPPALYTPLTILAGAAGPAVPRPAKASLHMPWLLAGPGRDRPAAVVLILVMSGHSKTLS